MPTDAEDTALPDTPTDAQPAATTHCTYRALPPTARAGGRVTEGDVRAGAAESTLDVPVGSALGAYTSRARFIGNASMIDERRVEYSGSFHPSVGIESAPRVRAVALTAGDETIVLLKVDLGAMTESLPHDVAERLGPEFAGKVLIVGSHSHSAPGHFTQNPALFLGFSQFRTQTYRRIVDACVDTAHRALDARVPARVGVAHDGAFDTMNRVSRDRRTANDVLPGARDRKDHDLFVIRIDRADGHPIAVIPIFGVHGTTLEDTNNLMSTDTPGAIERAIEESFDEPVVVMHLQGAAGDVSPAGSGGIECAGTPCYNFGKAETVGANARDPILAAWRAAGLAMHDRLAMEMLTRSVPLGPDWRTFTVRGGALAYAPFVARRLADRTVYDDAGVLVSPVDEFNAPFGAALCGGDRQPLIPQSSLSNVLGLRSYSSCARIEAALPWVSRLLEMDPPAAPTCASTRTNVSAIRLGDFVIASLPGEPLNLLADRMRASSPVPGDHTIVVGYAQGYIGYIATAEDWLQGEYEASLNVWGPLEGEYLGEQSIATARLAMTDVREDGATMGTTRWVPTEVPDGVPPADVTATAGTVPATVPSIVYTRGRVSLPSPQPAMQVARLASAYFAWVGEDPVRATPRVSIQREEPAGSGTFVALRRRSGREVGDGDVLLTETPEPLVRVGASPRTHYWVAEWQAVTPFGAEPGGSDALDLRAGLSIGRYRFHVAGAGYQLDSRAFDVVPAALRVTLAADGPSTRLRVAYDSPNGWRRLHATLPSNRPVPARGDVRVDVTPVSGAPQTLMNAPLDAQGTTLVPSLAPSAIRSVRVTDAFGNVGVAP